MGSYRLTSVVGLFWLSFFEPSFEKVQVSNLAGRLLLQRAIRSSDRIRAPRANLHHLPTDLPILFDRTKVLPGLAKLLKIVLHYHRII
jgi:hypothetical protein